MSASCLQGLDYFHIKDVCQKRNALYFLEAGAWASLPHENSSLYYPIF